MKKWIERKCITEGCWHWKAPGVIFCSCCLHGRCNSFTPEQKEQYLKEKAEAS